jgi:hypothetical protein
MKTINMYRVPMSRMHGAFAYIKATSCKEAQSKFDNDNIDRIEYDEDCGIEPNYEQDGPVEMYDEDMEEVSNEKNRRNGSVSVHTKKGKR